MSVGEALRDLRRVFDREGVPWYVFGAQAVMAHGVARTTQDIDVTALVAAAGAPALAAALADGGFRHRFPERAAELVSIAAVIPVTHIGSGIDVDVVLGGAGLEVMVHAAAEPRAMDGEIVPVATATHLVVMKILAGRGKDLDDVLGLIASGNVRIAEARALLIQLEEALDQSDLVPVLDRMVAKRRR